MLKEERELRDAIKYMLPRDAMRPLYKRIAAFRRAVIEECLNGAHTRIWNKCVEKGMNRDECISITADIRKGGKVTR